LQTNFADKVSPVVILSTADIDAPIWTNKQHIAVRLVSERDVHYVESLGLRAPRLSSKDLKRALRKVFARRSYSGETGAEGANKDLGRINVHSPFVIPFHAYALVRLLNHWLIRTSIMPRLPKRYTLWTFSPLTYGLEAGADRVIYHSVDLLHSFPGVPEKALLAAERRLIARADYVIASSKGVAEHLRSQGAAPLLWENVADIGLFYRSRSPKRVRRAIFVGNLTPTKVDFGLLEALISRGIRIALAGPTSIDGSSLHPALERLLDSPLVEYLGVLSQDEMAIEIGRSWVGIIPYHVNDYTAGVFPMKVYEYLAAGLQVVSTQLPSLSGDVAVGVYVVNETAFTNQVASICEAEFEAPDGDYSQNSWDARLLQIRRLLPDAAWTGE
jgi:teichuronic acid biosynthesis glycosyltransferase TuaH